MTKISEDSAGSCTPDSIALKSLFLGPQSENGDWFTRQVAKVLEHTIQWRKDRFPQDGSAVSELDRRDPHFVSLQSELAAVLSRLLQRLESEKPKFSPRYIGHMVSETSLPALLAEFAMLLHNPNNASREASSVGLVIEREAIGHLAEMVGFDPALAKGHFTSGGTLANFEAVWRLIYDFDRKSAAALSQIESGRAQADDFFKLCQSRSPVESGGFRDHARFSLLTQGHLGIDFTSLLGRRFQGPLLFVPGNKHYSWPKAASIFGLGLNSIAGVELDEEGRLDVGDLRMKIESAANAGRPILGVVSVAGTTELGDFDPVHEVQDLIDGFKARGVFIRHHVDAAYGGFFASLKRSPAFSSGVKAALQALSRVDTITLDPHKLGYVPYACGAFLARDQERYASFKVAAPYLDPTLEESSGWATTLEGSRSAAGAAAVWVSAELLPYTQQGIGRVLEKTLEAKNAFFSELKKESTIKIVTPVDSNVICFAVAPADANIDDTNELTKKIYRHIEGGPEFSVSRTELSRPIYNKLIRRLCSEWKIQDNGVSDLFVIRLVLMNPFIVSKETHTRFPAEFVKMLRTIIEARTDDAGL